MPEQSSPDPEAPPDALAANAREAARLAAELASAAGDPARAARLHNDLGVLAATGGDPAAARAHLRRAVELDPAADRPRENLRLLGDDPPPDPAADPPIRVALVSFLLNWPSTGGGNVHTVELGDFLARAGYAVRHLYARYAPWRVGAVGRLPAPAEAVPFAAGEWDLPTIRRKVREAVDRFDPDVVVLTDSWNMKPVLADAVRGYPYVLRLQALECLCPLNNVRLLPGPDGTAAQCPRHQLATPGECRRCVADRGGWSGDLHRAERELSGFGTVAYEDLLVRAFADADAVLVVDPLARAMVGPHAADVRAVTAGMDPARFPWPYPAGPRATAALLFAGLTDEWMKGYRVLEEACRALWRRRRDFELVVTADEPADPPPFARFVGWQSQDDLPALLRAADVLVVPTVAQEALGRTAVEAMACGVPVVASRLGGLPATVADGATGLLAEPGDAADLAAKIEALLDDPPLRRRFGEAGRRRFEERYAWPVVIDRHYRPLLRRRDRAVPAAGFRPAFPAGADAARLAADAARFLGRPAAWADDRLRAYRRLHDANGYADRFGERKTLCFEEAFLLDLLLAAYRPARVAAVGPDLGRPARRLLDMTAALGLDARLTCFDPGGRVEHVRPGEADVRAGDPAGRFREAVLDAARPDLLFLDVHPYPLLREAVADTLRHRPGCVLAVHDCGRGLCNPRMALPKDDPAVTSVTGVWERHVLAEVFGVADPLDPALDECGTAAHRLRVFDTPHGLAVIVPRPASGAAPEGRP